MKNGSHFRSALASSALMPSPGFTLAFGERSQGHVRGFALLSQAFRNNSLIPRRYTCDGWNLSPPLMWMHCPEETQSLVLIVEDPDAPEKPWTHWLLYNIPPGIRSLSEGIPPTALPDGCRQGKNDWGRTGYGGPCPPNDMHRYVHHLHALDCLLPDLGTPIKAMLDHAMREHVIGQAILTGLYRRPRY